MIRIWSTQKVDTLLKLVTLRLEDFKFIWNDIMAITTDGDGIILKLGRLVQCEHIVCLSQTLHLLAGVVLYEKCSHRTMKGTEYKSVTTNIYTQSKTKMTSAIYLAFLALPKLSPITDNIAIILKILSIIAIKNCTDNWQP